MRERTVPLEGVLGHALHTAANATGETQAKPTATRVSYHTLSFRDPETSETQKSEHQTPKEQ